MQDNEVLQALCDANNLLLESQERLARVAETLDKLSGRIARRQVKTLALVDELQQQLEIPFEK